MAVGRIPLAVHRPQLHTDLVPCWWPQWAKSSSATHRGPLLSVYYRQVASHNKISLMELSLLTGVTLTEWASYANCGLHYRQGSVV